MKTFPKAVITASAALGLSFDPSAGQQDAQRIANPAKAPATRAVHLEELWRIGGDTDAEGEIFGQIADLAVDADGSAYVLDRQLQEVRVFDGEGNYVRSFGRKGEGPGEFQSAIGLVAMPGGKIGVYQSNPPRMSLFADGDYAGEFHFAPDARHPFQFLANVQSRSGVIIVSAVDVQSSDGAMDQITRLMRFNVDGTFICELARTVRHFDFANLVVRDDASPYGVIGTDDSVLVVTGWDYEINAIGRDCRVTRTITRDYKHRARSDAEMHALTEYYRRGSTAGARIEISKVDRDVARMAVRDDGRTWVMSSRGRSDFPDDTLGVFDVYDLGGRLAEQVELKGEGNPRTDSYYFISDRLYVVRHCFPPRDGTVEEPEPMAVICYRMPS